MHEDLKKFMLRLATETDLLSRFVADADATAREEGLCDADREILFSGDQVRIYLAITGGEPPRTTAGPAAPPPAQQRTPSYVLAWTPWGWQWYAQ